MRFHEFKTFLKKNKLTEEAPDPNSLPSSKMTAAELFKGSDKKYIRTIAKSIEKGVPFAFFRGRDKDPATGEIEEIRVDGKTLSSADWMNWASNPEVDKAAVMKTKFVVDGEEFEPNKMYKSESVTGLKINKGDITEVILGAALTAKYYRGGSDIKANDIVGFMQDVVQNQKVTIETNYNTKGKKEDQIEFFLTLNAASMAGVKAWLNEPDPMSTEYKDFDVVTVRGVDPKLIREIQKLVKDGANYANNSKQIVAAVNKAKADPNRNLVEILSDGGDASQQSITKVDLKVMFDGEPTRLLSLKSGTVGQFGQESGGSWEAARRFVKTTLQVDMPDSLKDQFGFRDQLGARDKSYLTHNYSEGPFAKLYEYLEKKIKEYTEGDNTQKEYNLVQIVYDAINYHATKGEEGVTMVILSPSAKIAYKELAFDVRLMKALELYDLKVINNPGNKNHQLVVYGTLIGAEAQQELGDNAKELSTNAKLFQLRSAIQGGAVRNIIEMGPLLKELADVEKLEKQETADQKSAKEPQPKAGQETTSDLDQAQQQNNDYTDDRSF